MFDNFKPDYEAAVINLLRTRYPWLKGRTDHQVSTLWSIFSDDVYSANWIDMSYDRILKFEEWLKDLRAPGGLHAMLTRGIDSPGEISDV